MLTNSSKENKTLIIKFKSIHHCLSMPHANKIQKKTDYDRRTISRVCTTYRCNNWRNL